ncbi:uncharacterized protein FIBRA_06291 [Fibroporia radiculosa]|uniref:Uncharacterized protein n=1 Tax=Fibroporia radiculosa TaxID=599839 RepID=J4GSH3_9APHY|nr:uncharacterized protein FIBRA_06291 [Fibroporia radiculosa]CCM04130.1 predicted protein [Fibroporia radiculosa]
MSDDHHSLVKKPPVRAWTLARLGSTASLGTHRLKSPPSVPSLDTTHSHRSPSASVLSLPLSDHQEDSKADGSSKHEGKNVDTLTSQADIMQELLVRVKNLEFTMTAMKDVVENKSSSSCICHEADGTHAEKYLNDARAELAIATERHASELASKHCKLEKLGALNASTTAELERERVARAEVEQERSDLLVNNKELQSALLEAKAEIDVFVAERETNSVLIEELRTAIADERARCQEASLTAEDTQAEAVRLRGCLTQLIAENKREEEKAVESQSINEAQRRRWQEKAALDDAKIRELQTLLNEAHAQLERTTSQLESLFIYNALYCPRGPAPL